MISCLAVSPLDKLRHAMMTRAPLRARSLAVSSPIPALAPANTIAFSCKYYNQLGIHNDTSLFLDQILKGGTGRP